jgi:hypothetical protein
MKAQIEVFTALDNIASKHNIKDEAWALKSNIRRPSISELRRIQKNIANQTDEKIGRSCTVEKLSALFPGLYKILGGEVLRSELLVAIEKEKNQDIRMMLLTMILMDAPKETKDAVESNMKMATQTIKHKKR